LISKFAAYIVNMWPAYLHYYDVTKQNVYSFSVIREAFEKVSYTSAIEFDFPQGGCQQRAQIMSLILSKKFKIQHSKIWLFAPAALYENNAITLFIEDKNGLSPNNIVNWNYHLALAVRVQRENGEMDTLIIDPSIYRNKPVTISEWFAAMGNSGTGQYSFLTPEYYFFNCKYNFNKELTTVFDGTFFEFMNPVKDNLLMEKGLAVNDMAMTIYHKYIQPLMLSGKEQDNLWLNDLKDIFGNSTALDLLFSQNMSGYTENTSHRYIITNYSDIMKEAKMIFSDRLIFWTLFTNTLL
jgi:hypothetical protein